MRSSPLLPIFLIVLVDVLGLTLILPLLPFYAEKMGASPIQVGLLSATYAACQLIAGPILGNLSDRMGRKPLLLVSQMGTFIGFLILGQAEVLWLVFLSRAIDGFTAGNLSIAQAYISDVTLPENRAKAFGVIGVAFGLGFLVGPAVSGFLSQFGYHYPVYAAAGLSLLSIFATWRLLPTVSRKVSSDPNPGPGGKRLSVFQWGTYTKYMKNPELSSLLVQFFLFCLSFAIFVSGFALFAERKLSTADGMPYGPKEVGYVFAFSGLLGIILQGGLIGRLVKRFGEQPLVRWGFFSNALGWSFLAFTSKTPGVLLSGTASSFGHGVLRPALTSLITQKCPREEQGVVLGFTQSLNSMAQIIGPLIGGFLIDNRQLHLWAFAAGGVSALALFFKPRPVTKS